MSEPPDLEVSFPQLAIDGYRLTSPATPDYNCIAWAAKDVTRFWWPDPWNQYYWPPNAAREVTLQAFEQAYGTLGFEKCEAGSLEPGFEKIAIYTKSSVPFHAARQLPDGCWTSKLGSREDIEHDKISGVEGHEYGTVSMFMKRLFQ